MIMSIQSVDSQQKYIGRLAQLAPNGFPITTIPASARRLPGSQKLGMARGSPLPGGEKCHGDITASQIVDNDIFNDVMVIL